MKQSDDCRSVGSILLALQAKRKNTEGSPAIPDFKLRFLRSGAKMIHPVIGQGIESERNSERMARIQLSQARVVGAKEEFASSLSAKLLKLSADRFQIL